jgi:Tol biopolymer transport system component
LVVPNADGDGKRVFLVDAATGAKREITPARESANAYLGMPAWSPSGRLIAYVRYGVSGTRLGAKCWCRS